MCCQNAQASVIYEHKNNETFLGEALELGIAQTNTPHFVSIVGRKLDEADVGDWQR